MGAARRAVIPGRKRRSLGGVLLFLGAVVAALVAISMQRPTSLWRHYGKYSGSGTHDYQLVEVQLDLGALSLIERDYSSIPPETEELDKVELGTLYMGRLLTGPNWGERRTLFTVWPLAPLLLGMGAWIRWRRWRPIRRCFERACAACGYPRGGVAESAVCPACGDRERSGGSAADAARGGPGGLAGVVGAVGPGGPGPRRVREIPGRMRRAIGGAAFLAGGVLAVLSALSTRDRMFVWFNDGWSPGHLMCVSLDRGALVFDDVDRFSGRGLPPVERVRLLGLYIGYQLKAPGHARRMTVYSVWPLAPLLMGLGGWTWWTGLRPVRRAFAHSCVACGYPRGALAASAACPECGAVVLTGVGVQGEAGVPHSGRGAADAGPAGE